MGILRTDKISGLETPTAVTGSVSFDGTGDYLEIADNSDFDQPGDFTLEYWVYYNSLSGNIVPVGRDTGFITLQTVSGELRIVRYGQATLVQTGFSPVVNRWYHYALVRSGSDSNNVKAYVDGAFVGQASDTTSTSPSEPLNIGRNGDTNTNYLNGYVSNVRFLKGTALYTSDFTVPTHELEVIGDTVLLCCNNSDSAGADGTGKTITTNGDAAASTFSPGLTRDFTGGTEFKGVTTFDTQGYFVPPSGTTEQRGRGRGLIRMADNAINYITISSLGNSQDFGDATAAAQNTSACASSTRGLFSQGYAHPNYYKTIDYVTIASTGDAKDFGDITTSASFVYGMGGCASSTRGLFGGGFTAPSPNAAAGLKQINYVTIASLGDSQDFGDLTGNGVRYPAATSSPTRGLFAGGRDSADAPVFNQNDMHYVTIATLGNALDFGDLSYTPYGAMGTGSSTRGIFTGGYNSAGDAAYDNIDYITIASTGNAQDFGN